MVPNDALVRAIRSLGYVHKRQADRVHLYRKRGTTDRVAIRRNASHDPQYARTVLRQAGMDEAGIERFIAETDRRTH